MSDYEKMTDRELDAMVAERIMGIPARDVRVIGGTDTVRCHSNHVGATDGRWHRRELEYHFAAPHYSTDIAAAWEVVKKMRVDGWFYTITDTCGGHDCVFHVDDEKCVAAHNTVLPRAICVAALRAIDNERGRSEGMSAGTGIEWTQATWNPVVGCTRASAGCDHCYAVTMTHRLEKMGQPKYAGLTVLNPRGDRHFNGVVRCDESALSIPMHWKKPRRIFVNSMSDLFHKDVPFEFIDRVFAVMALCPQHTFQVLTKRPERMAEYFDTYADSLGCLNEARHLDLNNIGNSMTEPPDHDSIANTPWPLPNVWLGTSVEDQASADERIPRLLKCPATVRFLSCEPLLGAVDVGARLFGLCSDTPERIHWVIVGGESGPRARPCDVAWIRSIVEQCRTAGVPCFVKQLGRWSAGPHPTHKCVHQWLLEKDGARCVYTTPILRSEYATGPDFRHETPPHAIAWNMGNAKGGQMSEWPEDMRVRDFPTP